MSRQVVHTSFAFQANALATQFNELFGQVEVPTGHLMSLTAPDGPSTGGGVQSLQHLKLSPKGPGPVLVMGSLDTNKMTASVRTHGHLAHQARARGVMLAVQLKAYEAVADRVRTFLESMGFQVTVEEAPVEAAPAVAPPQGVVLAAPAEDRFWLGFIIGGGVVGALATIGTWLALKP